MSKKSAMPRITIARYNTTGGTATAPPVGKFYAGYLEPEDKRWILYIGVDGTPQFFGKRDANGGVIMVYAKEIAKLLSGSIGGVIVLMIVISGIQYILSAGSSSRVQAAKSRLTNAIIALVLFLMAFAIINFIVPGGIITG
jgi:hypothetical protein